MNTQGIVDYLKKTLSDGTDPSSMRIYCGITLLVTFLFCAVDMAPGVDVPTNVYDTLKALVAVFAGAVAVSKFASTGEQ